jgi:hypothetical protein
MESAIAQEYNISTPEASAEICRCAMPHFAIFHIKIMPFILIENNLTKKCQKSMFGFVEQTSSLGLYGYARSAKPLRE